MDNFIVILACLVAGALAKGSKRFAHGSAATLNAFIIWVSLPALILAQIPAFTTEAGGGGQGLWVPVSMAWINFAVATLLIGWIGRTRGWSPQKTGALTLTVGLANTSYVGFPLLEALMGPEAVRTGILVDQPGSFLVLSTLGVIASAYYSGAKVQARSLAVKIASFPPFATLVLALAWTLAGAPGYTKLSPALHRIAGTLVPLALFAVGLQLQLRPSVLRRRWGALALGLSFRLVLMPLLFVLLYAVLLGQRGPYLHATLLEAAMAPMITGAVLADEYHLDTELANLMVGLGIPLSLITVPLFHALLERWGLS
jgi:predicted permease